MMNIYLSAVFPMVVTADRAWRILAYARARPQYALGPCARNRPMTDVISINIPLLLLLPLDSSTPLLHRSLYYLQRREIYPTFIPRWVSWMVVLPLNVWYYNNKDSLYWNIAVSIYTHSVDRPIGWHSHLAMKATPEVESKEGIIIRKFEIYKRK